VSAATGTLALRVTVTDAWRTVAVRLPAGAAAGEVKRQALTGAGIDVRRAEAYLLKFAGTPVGDEARGLDALGVPDGAGLVVCPRRRRPVR
jgi:hypothetical protein